MKQNLNSLSYVYYAKYVYMYCMYNVPMTSCISVNLVSGQIAHSVHILFLVSVTMKEIAQVIPSRRGVGVQTYRLSVYMLDVCQTMDILHREVHLYMTTRFNIYKSKSMPTYIIYLKINLFFHIQFNNGHYTRRYRVIRFYTITAE